MAAKKRDLRNNDIFRSEKLPNGSYCTLTLLPEDGSLRLLIKDDAISCICMAHEDYEELYKALGAELRKRKKNGDLLTHETEDSTLEVVTKTAKPKEKATKCQPSKIVGFDFDAHKQKKIEEAMACG